ncbi:unnamed protein product [Caenorhabditis brenneri]
MGFLDIASTIMTPTVTRRHCAMSVVKITTHTSGKNLKWFLLDFDSEERTKWTFRDVFRGWNFHLEEYKEENNKTSNKILWNHVADALHRFCHGNTLKLEPKIKANSFCTTPDGKVWRRIRVMVKSSDQG